MKEKRYEKYEFIDLAKYGSAARKEIHPKVYTTETGKFPKGDILDANSVNDIVNDKCLFYANKALFEQDIDTIPANTIVFIQLEQLIWANGTYYSGGGGGSQPIDISATPIYYKKYIHAGDPVPHNLNQYTAVTQLSASRQWSVTLQNQFLFLAVPSNITPTRCVTSRLEELSLTENFRKDTESVSGHTVYIYEPTIAPENLTLTFTFSVL